MENRLTNLNSDITLAGKRLCYVQLIRQSEFITEDAPLFVQAAMV